MAHWRPRWGRYWDGHDSPGGKTCWTSLTDDYGVVDAAPGNYVFAWGSFFGYAGWYNQYSGNPARGMFGNNGAARIRDVTDGTSNSIAAGESLTFHCSGRQSSWGVGFYGAMGLVASPAMAPSAEWVRMTHLNMTIFDVYPQGSGGGGACVDPNCSTCGGGDLPYQHFIFASKHPGGANFVFGDGSVNFLSETINPVTWRNLHYIHDGNVIDQF